MNVLYEILIRMLFAWGKLSYLFQEKADFIQCDNTANALLVLKEQQGFIPINISGRLAWKQILNASLWFTFRVLNLNIYALVISHSNMGIFRDLYSTDIQSQSRVPSRWGYSASPAWWCSSISPSRQPRTQDHLSTFHIYVDSHGYEVE